MLLRNPLRNDVHIWSFQIVFTAFLAESHLKSERFPSILRSTLKMAWNIWGFKDTPPVEGDSCAFFDFVPWKYGISTGDVFVISFFCYLILQRGGGKTRDSPQVFPDWFHLQWLWKKTAVNHPWHQITKFLLGALKTTTLRELMYHTFGKGKS